MVELAEGSWPDEGSFVCKRLEAGVAFPRRQNKGGQFLRTMPWVHGITLAGDETLQCIPGPVGYRPIDFCAAGRVSLVSRCCCTHICP